MTCAPRRRVKAPPRCGSSRQPGLDRPQSLTGIVRAYIRDYRVPAERQRLEQPTTQRDLATIVRTAALSKLPDGRRHPHQRRIPGRVLQQAANALVKATFAAATFEDLHETVRKTIGPIRGIGELAVYDIACRIGTDLGWTPDRVYLHAGTREGARALGLGGATLSKSELPKEFHRLSPAEIEDCLCIYKDDLRRLAGGSPLRGLRRQQSTKRMSVYA
jgi:hypothetical protein